MTDEYLESVGPTNREMVLLLRTLQLMLTKEEPMLQFDIFGLSIRAHMLCKKVFLLEKPYLSKILSTTILDDEYLSFNIFTWLISAAQGEQSGDVSRRKRRRMVSISGLSWEDVVSKHITEHGNKACKKLQFFCRNKDLLPD